MALNGPFTISGDGVQQGDGGDLYVIHLLLTSFPPFPRNPEVSNADHFLGAGWLAIGNEDATGTGGATTLIHWEPPIYVAFTQFSYVPPVPPRQFADWFRWHLAGGYAGQLWWFSTI
jgi:hypothetical protein